MTKPAPAWTAQMIQQVDDKHEAGHHRLRTDLVEAIEESQKDREDIRRLLALQASDVVAMKGELLALKTIDPGRLIFPPKTVIAIVVAAVTLAGSIWATTSSVKGDLRDVVSKLNDQKELEAQKEKLQEERYTSLRQAVEDMNRRIQLQQYDIGRLNETIKERK